MVRGDPDLEGLVIAAKTELSGSMYKSLWVH